MFPTRLFLRQSQNVTLCANRKPKLSNLPIHTPAKTHGTNSRHTTRQPDKNGHRPTCRSDSSKARTQEHPQPPELKEFPDNRLSSGCSPAKLQLLAYGTPHPAIPNAPTMYNTAKGYETNHTETDSTGNDGNRRATYRLPPATRTDLPTFAPTVGKPPTPRPHHGLPSHEYAASAPHANTHLLPLRPTTCPKFACNVPVLHIAPSPIRYEP